MKKITSSRGGFAVKRWVTNCSGKLGLALALVWTKGCWGCVGQDAGAGSRQDTAVWAPELRAEVGTLR